MASRCVDGAPIVCNDANECTTDACPESGAMMCTFTPIAGCRRVTPQSGNYTLTPRLAHQCQDELFSEDVVNFNLASIRLDATPTSVTFTGGPVPLVGGAVTGGAFRATGTVPGMCITTLTLSGTFSDETRFTGQLALAFLGTWCQVTSCEARTIMVSGVRAP